MSNTVFPTGLLGARFTVRSEGRTTTFRTVSGRRQSVSWGSAISGYHVTLPVLRETVNCSGAWSAYSEAAAVEKVWTDHRDFDSFLLDVRAVGGSTQKRVKFVEGSFQLVPIGKKTWACEFDVEVVS